MPLYRYTARRANGVRKGEEVVAESPRALRDALRRSGWAPTSVRELPPSRETDDHNEQAFHSWGTHLKRQRRKAACAAFFDGIGTLLAIGMSLAEALVSVGENSNSRAMNQLCMRTADSVRQGDALSSAMHAAPDWFDTIDLSVIRSAERSGDLAQACAELADRHAMRDDLSNKLIASLSYPCVLVLLGLGVAGFLSTYTLPKIVGVLQDNQAAIPPSTSLLLSVSSTVTGYPILTVLGLSLCLLLTAYLAFSAKAEPLRWRLPILGTILKESALSRVATQIAWLVDSGVSLHEAIGLAAESSASPILRNALKHSRTQLADGVSITEAVRATGIFGGVFVRAVALGDESGEITSILHRLGDRYRRSAMRSLDRLTSVIEPAAIIVIAGLIGFVAYASIMPMLRVSETLY